MKRPANDAGVVARVQPSQPPLISKAGEFAVNSLELYACTILGVQMFSKARNSQMSISNRIHKIVFVLSLFLLASPPLQSQEKVSFRHLDVQDGLSQSSVHSILQDSYGFMWIGTFAGLNKYDGRQFTIYNQIPGDTTSLSDNRINDIFEDRDKNIWIATANGLNKLMLSSSPSAENRREIFKQYFHSPDNPNSLADNAVRKVYQDRSGVFWTGSATGFHRIEQSDTTTSANKNSQLRFTRYIHDKNDTNSISRGRISSIVEDRNSEIWIGTVGGGLNRLNRDDGTVIHYQHDPTDSSSLSSNVVITVYEDQGGLLWIGTYGGGLNKLDPVTGKFVHFRHDSQNPRSLSSDKVFSIQEIGNGIMWIGTFGGGLNKFNLKSEEIETFKNVSFAPQSLSNNFVRELYRDRSDILWVGTNGGVNLLDLKPPKFTHLYHDPHDDNTIQHNRVLSILEDHKKNLWIGTNKGLDRLNQNTGQFTHFEINHNNPRSPNGFVFNVFEDHSYVIWVATLGGGIFRFNKADNTFTQFKHDPQNPASLSDNRVYDIWEDRNKTLWIGTFNGLNKMDRKNGTFTKIKSDPADPATLTDHSITQLLESKDGMLWVGTNDGLNRLNPQNEQVTRFEHDPQKPNSLSHKIVTAIFEDRSGTIWVGTDYGLSRLNPQDRNNGKFTQYFERDGLPNNNICSIQGDDAGNLWIATIRGLSKFNPNLPSGKQFRNYDASDGLQSNEFFAGSFFKNPSGELFFGGINGLNRFFPKNVTDNPYPPPIGFTAFKKFDDKVQLGRSLADIDAIDLSYEDRFFFIEFAALDYTNPAKNRFAYKMEGFDEDWIDAGTRGFASYTNLDAGSYQFKVKAANNDGIWNEEGISLNINIAPPLWETWWFRLLAILMLGGLLAIIYRYRVAKLLEIERMRVRIASDLHDDVGSSLTKISLYSDLISSEPNGQEMRGLVEKIGILSRELIVTMSDIVWSIDARNDTVEDLLDRMRDFAVSVFSAKNIDYSFELDQLDLKKKLPINIRQNLYLIFKEAVNNVAKHSRATAVKIRLFREHGKFTMIVEDNGIGLNGNGKASGHGLNNMKMRAKRIDGTLAFAGEGGTKVMVSLEKI